MGTTLNKEAYKGLIKEDMEKVEKYFPEHSLEKRHIMEVLRCSIECYYPSEGKDQADTESKFNKHIVIKRFNIVVLSDTAIEVYSEKFEGSENDANIKAEEILKRNTSYYCYHLETAL